MKTIEDVVAWALVQVVGRDLIASGLGQVWRDEYVWRDLAKRILGEISARGVVILSKGAYAELVRDAQQMRVVRARIDEYKSFKVKDGP